MNIIDPQQSVTRVVEQLKADAAQRRRRLRDLALPDKDKGEWIGLDNEPKFPFDAAAPLLTLEAPLADKNQSKYRLKDLLAYEDRGFVQNAYRTILKRPPDPDGLSHAIDGLRSGRFSKVDILVGLSFSREGREKGVRISGLWLQRILLHFRNLPLLRYVALPVYQSLHLRSITRNQQRSAGVIMARQELIADHVNNLRLLAPLVQDALRLCQEQKKNQEIILERVSKLSSYFEERLNEEALRRQQEFEFRTAEIEDLRRVYNKYRTQVELTEKDLKRELEHLFRKHQEVKSELVFQNQRMGALLERGSKAVFSEPGSPEVNGDAANGHALDAFFASFDEHFRGAREDVKRRLRAYLPLIREHSIGSPEFRVLDVACGRGEWLDLLKEENLHAIGVDANGVLVTQCRERGLEVTQSDLGEYLRGVLEGSLGAVSAFHIVEHLSIERLISFLDQTLRVLRPGGLLLLETPNPQNVLVGSCNFYFDPTHRNPLPSPVLKFLVESRGFVVIETFGLNPSDEKPVAGDSELTQRFNEYFYGPMDYAIVARKV